VIHVQTGNMLDVVIEGKSLGLKQHDSDHRKYEVIWLPDPEALVKVLLAELKRLDLAPLARGVMPNYDPLGEKAAADVVLVSREACAQAIANEESPDYEHGLMEAGWEDAKVHFQEVIRALPPHGTKE